MLYLLYITKIDINIGHNSMTNYNNQLIFELIEAKKCMKNTDYTQIIYNIKLGKIKIIQVRYVVWKLFCLIL